MYKKMHQVTALGTREWGRTKPFCEQEYPNLYWTRELFDWLFFLLKKLGNISTGDREPLARVFIWSHILHSPENIQNMMPWWGLLVSQTCQGHSGDPFAPAGESTHISEKLKHAWHPGQSQTCFGYPAVPLQEWVFYNAILYFIMSFLNQMKSVCKGCQKKKSNSLPKTPCAASSFLYQNKHLSGQDFPL